MLSVIHFWWSSGLFSCIIIRIFISFGQTFGPFRCIIILEHWPTYFRMDIRSSSVGPSTFTPSKLLFYTHPTVTRSLWSGRSRARVRRQWVSRATVSGQGGQDGHLVFLTQSFSIQTVNVRLHNDRAGRAVRRISCMILMSIFYCYDTRRGLLKMVKRTTN